MLLYLEMKKISKFRDFFQKNRNPRDEGGVRFIFFACIYAGLHVCLWDCTLPPDQTKNNRDLKFDTHTPLDHI